MDKRYYLDACIWRDYFDNRSDKLRPIGEWAFKLIKKIIDNNDLFIISDKLLEELREEYSFEKLNNLFEIVPDRLIVKIISNEKTIKEAVKIKNEFKIPFGDALHIILAKESKSVLVTRDKHFNEIQNIIEIKKPEELI